MNDREIFQQNLNYYLSASGRMQKDLAEYVGAKTTTVSGWTRGVSYPRADSMEKIAMFFGIPTSRLITPPGEYGHPVSEGYVADDNQPQTEEARILAKGIDKLPKEQREQALSVIRAMFAKYADYFDKENDDDT